MSSVAPSYIRADIKITRDQPTPQHRQLIPTPKKGDTMEGKSENVTEVKQKLAWYVATGFARPDRQWRVNDVEYSIFFTQPFICFP